MIQEDPQHRDKIHNDYDTCARARAWYVYVRANKIKYS